MSCHDPDDKIHMLQSFRRCWRTVISASGWQFHAVFRQLSKKKKVFCGLLFYLSVLVCLKRCPAKVGHHHLVVNHVDPFTVNRSHIFLAIKTEWLTQLSLAVNSFQSYPTSLLVLAEPGLLLCLRLTLVLCCWLAGCLAVRNATSRGAETRSSRVAPAEWTATALDMCLSSPWDGVALGRRTRIPEWLDLGEVSPGRLDSAPSSGRLGECFWLLA